MFCKHIVSFYLVILNLLDIPKLVSHGWIPVYDKSKTILTQDLLTKLDIIQDNQSNITQFAIRTPNFSFEQKAIILPVDRISQQTNSFSII